MSPNRCHAAAAMMQLMLLLQHYAAGLPQQQSDGLLRSRALTSPPGGVNAVDSEFISVEFGGRTRDAILYVPAGASGALPLVFNYHGFG